MVTAALNAVGFCAHYSPQGDWAFDYALRLSKRHGIQLNVFHFLTDPYDPEAVPLTYLSEAQLSRLAVERERELRMYYDERAGDYLEVGFRLCEDTEWLELHRCLMEREFQILVLGYVDRDAKFARKPIVEFAESFVCPVVLVGPDHPCQFHLNGPAILMSGQLGLPEGSWERAGLVAR
jgi:hypothetical protein